MARKRKRSVVRRRRFRRRRNFKGRKTARIGRRGTTISNMSGGTPLPQKYLVKMKYVEEIGLVAAASVPGVWVFRLNSIFDPDFTGTGHQPFGRDQLVDFYHRYRVFRVDMVLIITAQFTSQISVTPFRAAGPAPPTIPHEAAEIPHTSYGVYSLGGPKLVIRRRFNLPYLLGMTSAQYKADDQTFALQGGGPPTEVRLQISGIAASATDATSISVNVFLWYYVEEFEPVVIGRS